VVWHIASLAFERVARLDLAHDADVGRSDMNGPPGDFCQCSVGMSEEERAEGSGGNTGWSACIELSKKD
jgi:hypothetical protein